MTGHSLRLFLACAALVLIAAAPRFHRLGALSLHGDEGITAWVARSVQQGEGARLPSGLEYRRALPFTWLAAGAAHIGGAERELSYRLPAALLGTLTIPLLFLLARQLIGPGAAWISALLLAFSQWHLVFSRMARMYAPFVFLYVAAVFALLVWARTGRVRWLWCALPLALLAAFTHQSGVLVVVLALLPLVIPTGNGRVVVPRLPPLVFALAVMAATFAWERWYVTPPYAGWTLTAAEVELSPSALPSPDTSPTGVMLIILGALVAVWTSARARRDDSGWPAALAVHGSAAVAGGLLGAGQLYGAALAIGTWLLLSPPPRVPVAQCALLALIAAAGSALTLSGAWGTDATGWAALTAFPQPYGVVLARDHTVLVLLAAATATGLVLRTRIAGGDALRLLALTILLTIGALGLSDRTPERRYALSVYPLLLLVAAPALLQLCALPQRWQKRWRPPHALAAAIMVVLIGGIGTHGVQSALLIRRLEHGETAFTLRAGYPPFPDHAAAGLFVRRMRGTDDVVIAEHPISQRWYAGRADYWFRAPALTNPYVYRAADGRLRDQYVNAVFVDDPALLDSVVAVAATNRRVWYITSAQMGPVRRDYFSARQYAWVDSLERARAPVFTARDGITRVYCLNCTGQ